MQAKGKIHHETWKLADGRAGTVDDVSVFVIPLLPYQKEYISWKDNQESDMHDSELSVNFGQLSLKQSPGKTSFFPVPTSIVYCHEEQIIDISIKQKKKGRISLIESAQASSATSTDSRRRNRSSSVPSQYQGICGRTLTAKRSKSFTDINNL